MNKFFCIALFFFITGTTIAQSLPDGYILLYQQNFSTDSAIRDFKFSHPNSWKLKTISNNRLLEFSGQSLHGPDLDSNGTLGIIKGHIFGDFILEVSLMQTCRDCGLPDLCILYSTKDPSHFYAINLASRSTDSTHGIFLIKNAPRVKVSDWQTDSLAWGNEKWHKVRVERSIVNRTVTVYIDDMKRPVMATKNPGLIMGYLGFGSFSGSGRIDNIKVWAPTSIPEEAPFFEGKGSP